MKKSALPSLTGNIFLDELFAYYPYLSTKVESTKKKQKTTKKSVTSEDDENIFHRIEQYALLISLRSVNNSICLVWNMDKPSSTRVEIRRVSP